MEDIYHLRCTECIGVDSVIADITQNPCERSI